jgi:hypothetical protein
MGAVVRACLSMGFSDQATALETRMEGSIGGLVCITRYPRGFRSRARFVPQSDARIVETMRLAA